jgi:hypothetical protein
MDGRSLFLFTLLTKFRTWVAQEGGPGRGHFFLVLLLEFSIQCRAHGHRSQQVWWGPKRTAPTIPGSLHLDAVCPTQGSWICLCQGPAKTLRQVSPCQVIRGPLAPAHSSPMRVQKLQYGLSKGQAGHACPPAPFLYPASSLMFCLRCFCLRFMIFIWRCQEREVCRYTRRRLGWLPSLHSQGAHIPAVSWTASSWLCALSLAVAMGQGGTGGKCRMRVRQVR